MKKKRWLLLLIVIILGLLMAGIYGYGVYRGWFLLNHPSHKKYPVRGVDVSHYQGEIDWPVLSGQGIEFAYIKATEGSSHQDDRFVENWTEARNTNLAVGAYHFFSFDSGGHTQADNMIAAIGQDYSGMLTPVVDVEFYGGKKNQPPDPEAAAAELEIMLTRLEQQYQVKPIIYTTEDVWELYIKDRFDEYPLWIRNVISKPRIPKAYPWLLWQYTNREKIAGYAGDEEFIDMNVFSGDRASWAEFLKENTVNLVE